MPSWQCEGPSYILGEVGCFISQDWCVKSTCLIPGQQGERNLFAQGLYEESATRMERARIQGSNSIEGLYKMSWPWLTESFPQIFQKDRCYEEGQEELEARGCYARGPSEATEMWDCSQGKARSCRSHSRLHSAFIIFACCFQTGP